MPLSNAKIVASRVKLASDDGLHEVSLHEALHKAAEAGLDLVQVAPGENGVPVCKIMNQGKKLFDRKKNTSGAHKHKKLRSKEVKFSVNVEEHDYQVKLRKLRDFLESGHKVKVSLMFRGRQITHADLGKEMMNRVKSDVADCAVVEADLKCTGRMCDMALAPAKQTKKTNLEESKDA